MAGKAEDKKKYVQLYTRLWEKEEILKDWLGPCPDGDATKAYCKYCRSILTAHKKGLIIHAKSSKHIVQVSKDKQAKMTKKLNFTTTVNLTKQVKIAELQLCVYIAEHSSIRSIDHLCELLPQIDKESNITGRIKLHRTKCTMLIKNVIAPCMLTSLVEDVSDSKYSIIVDESTDLSCSKNLCIMLKYYSKTRENIITTFYRLIQLEKFDADALFQSVKKQMETDGLNINNLIGIGTDGASVMVGKHHSFSTLFKDVVPDIFIVRCVCHSMHLAAEYACSHLPGQLDFLMKQITGYFSHSTKKMNEYKELLKSFNSSFKKIPNLSTTRWLARSSCVTEIVNQWNQLVSFFEKCEKEDKCYTAKEILKIMKCPAYKSYLFFLKHILQDVSKINILFQSEKKIVVPAQLQKVHDNNLLEFNFEQHIMHHEVIHFGYEFHVSLTNLPTHEINDIKIRCRNFLIELCRQIKIRLPENIAVLQTINVFKPTVATSQRKPSILNIIQRCNYPVDKTVNEWNCLSNKQWQNTDDPVKFWVEVSEDKDAAGNYRFKNISNLALHLLALPVSNATVERAFSIFGTIKNKLRNKMLLNTVESIMTVRYFLNIDNLSCKTFKPTDQMIAKFNVSMYNQNKVEDNEEAEILDTIAEET